MFWLHRISTDYFVNRIHKLSVPHTETTMCRASIILLEPFLHLQRVYCCDMVTQHLLQQISCVKVRVGISHCMSNIKR